MKRKRRDWKKLVDEYELSGLSTIDFCKSKGLSLSNFYARRKELSRRSYVSKKLESFGTQPDTSTAQPSIDLVEVKPTFSSKTEPQPTLRFTTADGLSVEVYL